ncbi:hypothetical protein GYB59_02235 [bacterium]|nr:hypothetical protein [bacterium]
MPKKKATTDSTENGKPQTEQKPAESIDATATDGDTGAEKSTDAKDSTAEPGEATEGDSEPAEAQAEANGEAEKTKAQAKRDGKLSLYDEVSARLVFLNNDYDECEAEIAELQSDLKKLRDNRNSLMASINAAVKDLRDVRNGCYQRNLFTPANEEDKPEEKPAPVDPAVGCSISNLGLSDKECELLVAAELDTIAKLEKRMRENEWWHRDIKGFGPAKVDKLVDNLMAWRQRNPMPSAEDASESDDNEPTEVDAAADQFATVMPTELQHLPESVLPEKFREAIEQNGNLKTPRDLWKWLHSEPKKTPAIKGITLRDRSEIRDNLKAWLDDESEIAEAKDAFELAEAEQSEPEAEQPAEDSTPATTEQEENGPDGNDD